MINRLFPSLFVGVVAGATAGLLLAPKPGKVTRRFARQRSIKYVEGVKERINRGTSRITT